MFFQMSRLWFILYDVVNWLLLFSKYDLLRYSSHLHVALAQFESLLWNKEFVVQMEESLERQPGFSAQDRVYVASLARNMQYCTDVIFALLRRLIDKNLESR